MGKRKRLSADQLELYEGIDNILWVDWDPIGISGPDWPRDEYASYLPHVFALAIEDATSSQIAEYLYEDLYEVVTERMGLSSAVDQQLGGAEKIRNLKLTLVPERR